MSFNYSPLWDTMKGKSVSKYQLMHKHNISPSIITRLQRNQSVEIKTIDKLCSILDCSVEDVVKITREE